MLFLAGKQNRHLDNHDVALANLDTLEDLSSDRPSFIGGVWGTSSVILGALEVAWPTSS